MAAEAGAGRTSRMRWLSVSATKREVPLIERATPCGLLKTAVTAPSAKPETPGRPASVLTAPVEMTTCRTRWLP